MDAVTVVLQLVISGILVGSVYGLTAMGFVITYRSARVFNIAYGQFSVLGAFLAWTFLGSPQSPRLPLPLALVLTLLAVVAHHVPELQFRPEAVVGRGVTDAQFSVPPVVVVPDVDIVPLDPGIAFSEMPVGWRGGRVGQ